MSNPLTDSNTRRMYDTDDLVKLLSMPGAPDKFPARFEPFEMTYQGDTLKVHQDPAIGVTTPRELVLHITSWVGISIGAVHTYASLKTYSRCGAIFEYLDGTPYQYSVLSGGPPCLKLDMQVHRPADKRDVEYALDREFESTLPHGPRIRLGDPINQFWSEEEAREYSIRFFLKYFGPGWILVPESWEEDERPILASTFTPPEAE